MEKASKIVVAGSNGMVGSNQNAGVEMCKFYKKQYGCNFISGMSSKLYGINVNFNSFK